MRIRSLLIAAALAVPAALTTIPASAAPLAPTPPMGWNDWAHYQCDYTEQTILDNADALVSTGLAAKGYNTVTIDDCWIASSRDSNGNLVADSTRFPGQHGLCRQLPAPARPQVRHLRGRGHEHLWRLSG